MTARDELIERLLAELKRWDMRMASGWEEGQYENRAEAALSVVETARSTCPECMGSGYGNMTGSRICPSCGGQPGPLLALQMLCERKDSIVIGDDEFILDPPLWRFPRRQEGELMYGGVPYVFVEEDE